MKIRQIKQCSLCSHWTHNYINVPSGDRNPRTGETPMDNVVCGPCQREARAFNLLGRAAEKYLHALRAA